MSLGGLVPWRRRSCSERHSAVECETWAVKCLCNYGLGSDFTDFTNPSKLAWSIASREEKILKPHLEEGSRYSLSYSLNILVIQMKASA